MIEFPSQLVQAASWWADPGTSEDTAPPNRVSDLRLLSTNTSTSGHQVGSLEDGFYASEMFNHYGMVPTHRPWSLVIAAELCHHDYE